MVTIVAANMFYFVFIFYFILYWHIKAKIDHKIHVIGGCRSGNEKDYLVFFLSREILIRGWHGGSQVNRHNMIILNNVFDKQQYKMEIQSIQIEC